MKYVLIIISVLIIVYVSSYYIMVKRNGLPFMSGVGPWPGIPSYSIESNTADYVFSPMHEIDIIIRPNHWNCDNVGSKNEMRWLDGEKVAGY